MPPQNRGEPLRGLRVLELGTDVAARYAGWWLAECGADVATFRPNWNAPDNADPEARFERHVGRGKRLSDFERDAPYDVIVTDVASLEQLRDQLPAALTEDASIAEVTSPLPTATSFAETLRSDMALWARSGLGYLTREVDDDGETGPPCLPLSRQASLLAGVAAATAAATAAIERTTGAGPRRISCDKLELLALLPMQPTAVAQLTDGVVGQQQPPSSPGGNMPSADGMAFVRAVEPAHWASLFRLVDGLDWAAAEVEQNPELLRESRDELDRELRAWASRQGSDQLVEVGQAEHVPLAAIYRHDQVIRDRHLAARGFFRTGAPAGGINLPWHARVGQPVAAAPQPASRSFVRPGSALPLAGLRILDLTWAWAGPFATTMLADLGAEVINIEWHPRVSNLRRNGPHAEDRADSNSTAGWWSANQRGKYSVGVNMKDPDGKRIIKDLAARSDIVVENFSPGVVERLGVGFDDLLEANPRLVYVSLSAFGQTGPHSHYVGYGTQIYAASGAGYATSQDGETFSHMLIPYPDPVSGLVGAYAIAAYTYQARTTGQPAYVDVSDLEAFSAVVLEPLLDAIEDDASGGNLEPSAPSTSYLVLSTADDRFVALLARDAADWPAFQQALGAADVTPGAIRAVAELLQAQQLLKLVAQAGLAAEPIAHSGECLRDPALTDSGFWTRDESPEIFSADIQIGGAIWHVDGDRAPIWRGAPPLFADTRAILQDVLDYPPSRVDHLFARGAVE